MANRSNAISLSLSLSVSQVWLKTYLSASTYLMPPDRNGRSEGYPSGCELSTRGIGTPQHNAQEITTDPQKRCLKESEEIEDPPTLSDGTKSLQSRCLGAHTLHTVSLMRDPVELDSLCECTELQGKEWSSALCGSLNSIQCSFLPSGNIA